MKPRSLVVVPDSAGRGHAPDAAAFGDEGADTFGHMCRNAVLGEIRGFGYVAARVARHFQLAWSAMESVGNR
ncbi:MAG: hypothetical protein NTV93_17610 [Verrucomicrobia bacterium]|nr:hypothetical protein [Verrucomicrobiota bacterium]